MLTVLPLNLRKMYMVLRSLRLILGIGTERVTGYQNGKAT